MSKSSRPIWKTALDNVAELPPCPDDLSEPLYAALVFDVHCFVRRALLLVKLCDVADGCTQACGVNDAFGVDYALRVRMCKRCYEEKYISVANTKEM